MVIGILCGQRLAHEQVKVVKGGGRCLIPSDGDEKLVWSNGQRPPRGGGAEENLVWSIESGVVNQGRSIKSGVVNEQAGEEERAEETCPMTCLNPKP